MKTNKESFQFTLILKNVTEDTANLEDSLFEAGCDDALINSRSGAIFLDFDREAKSFEDAIYSAINDVESSSVRAVTASVAPETLVTMSEAAKRLNKTRQALSLWIKQERRRSAKSPFPQPILNLTEKSPLWKWSEILNWLYLHNLITEKKLLDRAIFIENLNAALEFRYKNKRKKQQLILGHLIHNQFAEDF